MYGRRAPKRAPSLKFASFHRSGADVPDHLASEDQIAALSAWGVLGNDQYNNCVATTWAHQRRTLSTLLGRGSFEPTTEQVDELYRSQNPAFPHQDDGMEVQTCLEHLLKNGGPDGVRPVAFALVDHADLEEVKAALAIFGTLWVGLHVQEANLIEFRNGWPWDYTPGSALDGGHAVMVGGYLGRTSDDVHFVSWGVETGCTDLFWRKNVEEAWVVVWPEHLEHAPFKAGVDQGKLADAYKAVTGRRLQIQLPPSPMPPLVQKPAQESREMLAVKRFHEKTAGWAQERHGGSNQDAAEAAIELFRECGLE